MSKYNVKLHLAQRIENLLNAKETGNINGFFEILNDVEHLMKDKPDLLKCFETDKKNFEESIEKAFVILREELNKRLTDDDNDSLLSSLENNLNAIKNVYGNAESKYIDDLTTSILTFLDNDEDFVEDESFDSAT